MFNRYIWPLFLLTTSWYLATNSIAAPMKKDALTDLTNNSGVNFKKVKISPDLKGEESTLVVLKAGDVIELGVEHRIRKLTIISGPSIGSTAAVFKTQDEHGKIYAFKYFKCVHNSDIVLEAFYQKRCDEEPLAIKNEIDALQHLNSFVQSGIYEKRMYIIMAFVEGEPIASLIHKSIKSKEDLEDYKSAAKNALDDLHKKGIAHNDLHIENILFDSGSPVKATIIDFGHSVKATDASIENDNLQFKERFEERIIKLGRKFQRSSNRKSKVSHFKGPSGSNIDSAKLFSSPPGSPRFVTPPRSPRSLDGTPPGSPTGFKMGGAFDRN